MKIFKCPKCNSTDVFTQANGHHVGLFCGDCGGWIKWLSKSEQRLVERQIAAVKDTQSPSPADESEVS